MKKARLTLLLFALVISNALIAQDLDLSTAAESFYEQTIKPLFPIVLGIVFIVTSFMNIGLVLDENNRNWKLFLTRVLMFVGAALLLMLVANFLATLSI